MVPNYDQPTQKVKDKKITTTFMWILWPGLWIGFLSRIFWLKMEVCRSTRMETRSFVASKGTKQYSFGVSCRHFNQVRFFGPIWFNSNILQNFQPSADGNHCMFLRGLKIYLYNGDEAIMFLAVVYSCSSCQSYLCYAPESSYSFCLLHYRPTYLSIRFS